MIAYEFKWARFNQFNPLTVISIFSYKIMDKQDLTIEQAFQRLEEITQKLEAGQLDLETTIALFEEGMKLAEHCSQKLDEAELRVTQLTINQ